MKNLIGLRFGQLTVLERAESRKSRAYWKCLCDCGNTCEVSTAHLTGGSTISCGCAKKGVNAIDISGQRFGKLVAIEPTSQRMGHSIVWRCQCDCGNQRMVAAIHLRKNVIQSCGCMAAEAHKASVKSALNERQQYIVSGTDALRIVNNAPYSNNTSGYTGVSFDISVGLWKAAITFRGKKYYLGGYQSKEDAINARIRAEKQLHGNFLKWYAKAYPSQWEKIIERLQSRQGTGETKSSPGT